MTVSAAARKLPAPVKRGIRRTARWAARIRNTRVWPVVRPLVRPVRRLVDVDRVLGQPAPAPDGRRMHIDTLRRRLLNLGLNERAVGDLRSLAEDGSDPVMARMAAWELAMWHADQYQEADARQALEFLRQAAAGEQDPGRLRQIAVVTAECQARVGDLVAARAIIHSALADGPDPNLFLAAANLEPEPAGRVEWLNRALAEYGLAAVALSGPVTGGVFDRLAGTSPEAAAGAPRVVSVIIPAYNAAQTIRTAVDSVLAQTWPHLEVLVVDDASSDGTASVVSEYAGRDPRVRLLRAERNGGTYVARNLALREATGEFVTCHDTDDWSHPEKIERQVRHLIDHPEVVANTSQQVRATADLTFYRRGKPGFFVFMNLSSLMFRREPVQAELGYWDSVRFGADAELLRRLRREFPEAAVVDLPTGPLTLQRQSAGSLTANQVFGYHGYFMGARNDYFETYNHYHRTRNPPRYEFPQHVRPFPAPAPMLPVRPAPDRDGRRHFDVIIASDFRLVGGSTVSSVEEIAAHRRHGLRTGLVQMYYYDADPRRSVTPRVRDVIDGDRVQMIVYGERVSCDLLIIRYPPVLQEWHRFLPDVAAQHVRVIVNQPPMSDYGPDAVVRYQIPRCHEHLRRYFGQAGVWHPIGPLVRQALHQHHVADLDVIELSDEDWVNIIDVDAWRRTGRPARGPRTRIGRHSRDHPVKWPGTRQELLGVYPDSSEYEVHVLGGGETPLALLGYQPPHWHITNFGHVPPAEFLAGLDVFVYYPNREWVESFGRVVLEAMAAGVPVVLPPTFRPLFGDAARYAEPADALAVVDELMGDDDLYSARVDLALRFVEKHFGHSKHIERIGRYTAYK